MEPRDRLAAVGGEVLTPRSGTIAGRSKLCQNQTMTRESATLPRFTPTPRPIETSVATHLVLVPSFNSGKPVYEAIRAARHEWMPVWVVVDGSTDGTAEGLRKMAKGDPGLRVIVLPDNRGKGAAILHGARLAEAQGFSHVVILNAEAHSRAGLITDFIAASVARPEALILGVPAAGGSRGSWGLRRIFNWCANVETLWWGIGDALCGFRVYPIAPLLRLMDGHRWMRRADFDPESVVRMAWDGIPVVNMLMPVAEGALPAPRRTLGEACLLGWMHLRLFAGFLRRLPCLVARRLARLRELKESTR